MKSTFIEMAVRQNASSAVSKRMRCIEQNYVSMVGAVYAVANEETLAGKHMDSLVAVKPCETYGEGHRACFATADVHAYTVLDRFARLVSVSAHSVRSNPLDPLYEMQDRAVLLAAEDTHNVLTSERLAAIGITMDNAVHEDDAVFKELTKRVPRETATTLTRKARVLKAYASKTWLNNCIAVDEAFFGGAFNFINHSCRPNCALIDSEEKRYLVSLKPIAAGEEVTISYIMYPFCYSDAELMMSSKLLAFSCKCPNHAVVDYPAYRNKVSDATIEEIMPEGRALIVAYINDPNISDRTSIRPKTVQAWSEFALAIAGSLKTSDKPGYAENMLFEALMHLSIRVLTIDSDEWSQLIGLSRLPLLVRLMETACTRHAFFRTDAAVFPFLYLGRAIAVFRQLISGGLNHSVRAVSPVFAN